MAKLPKRIHIGEVFYKPSDLSPELLDIYLKYEFAARRESEVKQYLSILTGNKTLIALELKKEILSSKAGFNIENED